ncbi:hypothetical protein [Halioxenophilus sp. WMMB6]|uniref:hypothetical protein n=1 Tax=Halioxenophilus sp. WMMB6 TaxID=3073815 RepID=UPI00295F504C|nr:hypothetical protein [Halioxenophilus sp. WMMB6]
MNSLNPNPITVIQELLLPQATVQLVNYPAKGPVQETMHECDEYWLDLTLTPRPINAQANYLNHWHPGRFESLGRIFLVPRGEMLCVRGEGSKQQTSLVCKLSASALHEWLDCEQLSTDARLAACLNISDGRIHQLLNRMAAEVRDPGLGSEALTELISAQLAIELGRFCNGISPRLNNSTQGLNERQLRLITERCRKLNRRLA